MEPDERNRQGMLFADYADALREQGRAIGAEIVCERHEIPDMTTPAPGQMVRILDAIDSALERDAPVYIHCWGGRGRTGTVVGCWLVRHGLARDGHHALQMIEQMRAALPDPAGPSPETRAQRAMVIQWGMEN
jgi:protein-tyrosine phosphatase